MTQAEQAVSFPSGTKLEGYLVRPPGDGPFPGVVIIHEIFGLNDNIREIARRFANEGYVALAVDLFAGRNRAACMYRVVSDQFFNRPEKNKGISDLKQALTFLAEQPGVDKDKLGAIGFCMGGYYAIAWACTDARLKVIAPYYAMNPRPLEAVARACPVVGSYPDKDFTTKPGQQLEVTLAQSNITHDIKVYPDTRHSFFNDRGATYNEAAAKDSWQRVMAFFKAQLNK